MMSYLEPMLTVLLLGLVAVLVWHARRRDARSRACLIMVVLGLFAVSSPAVAWLSSATLEGRYWAGATLDDDIQAIVVLAGYVSPPRDESPYVRLGDDTYVRCRHAAWLFQQSDRLPVVVCGDKAAMAMKAALMKEGVPESLIWLEDRSGSTHENALFAAAMLKEKGISRIALVTEANHMRRSEACFAQEGLDTVPFACAFRTQRFKTVWHALFPSASAIRTNEEALHEWLGLLWYRVRGWV